MDWSMVAPMMASTQTPLSGPSRAGRAAAFALAGLMLLACGLAFASKAELDARVQAALATLQHRERAVEDLLQGAAGVLVFPRVFMAGFGLGGAVGEGALLVDGQTVQYYRTTKASFGFQTGAQARSEIIVFVTQAALDNFRASSGWEAGVDGSIALIKVGANREIDTYNTQAPIVGFVFGGRGLMYDLSLAGSKYWKINKREGEGDGAGDGEAAN